jgi:hypothetical protein
MIDDDDVFAALVFLPSGGRGPLGLLVGLASLAIIIGLMIAASSNNDECGRMSCPEGQKPRLMKNECLCVQPAKP